ncbi:uncharacterized protein LOC126975685 [Leptidea sinapis]|uniref:uncharacterized protein LOC126975685 n=1 Tax=Leptidea sinapis TaxID=189913 RepID=UPI00212EF2AB|nr:uncharacterized protein LOC126975685 [Leptidea sinapis]
MTFQSQPISQRPMKDDSYDKNYKDARKNWDPVTAALMWIENNSQNIEKYFERIPAYISNYIATLAIFTFGATLRGEWVVILISALKQFYGHTQSERNVTTEEIYNMFTSQNLKMENFGFIFIISHIVSYGSYFGISGFLHWYYYTNRRHVAHEWKIQPTKWLSPELERHEIMVGVVSLFITGSFSAFLATYIANENPSSVYFQFNEYGWLWFFLQFPAIFIYQDFTTYILHRMYHTPWLYKHFHKLHHKYKQPTAFSVTAIHPFEIMHVQSTSCLPLFLFPVHWLPFYIVVLYTYYHGTIDHSGINFKAQWWQPWQPDAEFHDQHHEFFHCNFGFNMSIWDKWFGTMRKNNRVYTEKTFHGEAPTIDSPEAKEIIDSDPEIKETVKKIKSSLNLE